MANFSKKQFTEYLKKLNTPCDYFFTISATNSKATDSIQNYIKDYFDKDRKQLDAIVHNFETIGLSRLVCNFVSARHRIA